MSDHWKQKFVRNILPYHALKYYSSRCGCKHCNTKGCDNKVVVIIRVVDGVR